MSEQNKRREDINNLSTCRDPFVIFVLYLARGLPGDINFLSLSVGEYDCQGSFIKTHKNVMQCS